MKEYPVCEECSERHEPIRQTFKVWLAGWLIAWLSPWMRDWKPCQTALDMRAEEHDSHIQSMLNEAYWDGAARGYEDAEQQYRQW